MLGKQHLAFGICSGIAFTSALSCVTEITPQGAACFVFTMGIGAIFPDIDHPDSIVSKKAPFVSKIVTRFVKHRTITHDILVYAVILVLMLVFKAPFVLFGFPVGCISHLFLDGFTVNGLPIAYLFNKEKKLYFLPKKMRPKSSGAGAAVLTVLFCIISIFLAGLSLYKGKIAPMI